MSTEFGSTRYGFTWGPMKVERAATFDQPRGGSSHVVSITTDREQVEIYVSRTGMIRVFRKGKNCGEMKVQP